MLRIFEDIFRSSLFEYPAFVHEDNFVCNILCKAHFMGYNNHSHVAVRKGFYNLEHFAGKFRVKSGGRFIEAENIGF